MKTAVEWLIEQIEKDSDIIFYDRNLHPYEKYIQQAKKMEKEQIKDSYKEGFAYRDTWNWELNVDWDKDIKEENENEFEQYYNETFKSE